MLLAAGVSGYYKLMDLRIPFGIGVKSQSVLVRDDTSMVYRRAST